MKTALLNSLRVEGMNKLSKEERKKLVNRLKNKYKLSNRKLQELTGIPHSTIHDWASGRQTNTGVATHVSIDMMLRKLDGYKPKLSEFSKLEKLKKIIENILELKY